MTVPGEIQRYLSRHSVDARWRIISRSLEGVDSAVVIPALAESDHLFMTLAGLSENPPAELARTLVICVINNGGPDTVSTDDLADNRETLERLRKLVNSDKDGLRVAYVDASSPGLEMPDKTAGVGLARKIGMDLALGVFDYGNSFPKLILSLDADTLVEDTYLSSVREAFEREKVAATVVSFAHQEAKRPDEQAAICCYELFLRSYVLGLRYAGSPYAFHSIGSTMACTAGAYAAVRGMNTRKAGEDFYFLDKLSKTGTMRNISETTVHPSSRTSGRVPFGTGKRIIRFSTGEKNEYTLYNPRSFEVLKEWLDYMASCPDVGPKAILARAGGIHPSLEEFLRVRRFGEIWPRLVQNSGDEAHLRDHFTRWFDGFETFKLVRHLTMGALPPVDMFTALGRLVEMMGGRLPVAIAPGSIPPLRDQMVVLEYLRKIDNRGLKSPCISSSLIEIETVRLNTYRRGTMGKAKEILKKREANRRRLEKEAPNVFQGFNDLMKQYYKPGMLDRKYKELMAVTAAIATRCVPCLANHANNALSSGATREEIFEAAAIGVEFGGGPSFIVVRDHLLDFLDDLEGEKKKE